MYLKYLFNRFMVGGALVVGYTEMSGAGAPDNHYLMQFIECLLAGLFVNTAASLIIDPVFNFTKALSKRDYKLFVKAAAVDPQINELNAERVLYRDLIMMFMLLSPITLNTPATGILVGLAVMAFLRLVKFNQYIVKRIDCA